MRDTGQQQTAARDVVQPGEHDRDAHDLSDIERYGLVRHRSTCATSTRTSVPRDSAAAAPIPARAIPRVASVRKTASGAGEAISPRAARMGTPKQSQASPYAATQNRSRNPQSFL